MRKCVIVLLFLWNQHKNNKSNAIKRTKYHKETKKINKSVEFNKYEGSKGSNGFNYIKMPYIDTTVVESKNLLIPLKYNGKNKPSVDTEYRV